METTNTLPGPSRDAEPRGKQQQCLAATVRDARRTLSPEGIVHLDDVFSTHHIMDVVLYVLLGVQLIFGVTLCILINRFRRLHERVHALRYCLDEAGIVAYRTKYLLKMERLHRNRSVKSVQRNVAAMLSRIALVEKYLSGNEPDVVTAMKAAVLRGAESLRSK